MLVYISYSPSDSKLYKSLRDQCEAKGFTIVTREKTIEFKETLTDKGIQKIELANVAVILRSALGRSSFRVFLETDFIASICKDHFILEGPGKTVGVKKIFFEDNAPLGNTENYHASLDALEKLLFEFASQLNPEAFNFIYHTDMIY